MNPPRTIHSGARAEAVRLQRGAVAVGAPLRVDDRRPGDVRDRRAPLLDQVRRRQPSDLSSSVTTRSQRDVGVIVAVDHHEADAERAEPLQQVGVARRR